MSDEHIKTQQLTYALGLAIGALETINATPYDFDKDGLVNILKRLKGIAEASNITPTTVWIEEKSGVKIPGVK